MVKGILSLLSLFWLLYGVVLPPLRLVALLAVTPVLGMAFVSFDAIRISLAL